MKNKKFTDSDLWDQAVDIYTDIDTQYFEPYTNSNKFIKLLINNKFKITNKVKEEISKNRFDQMLRKLFQNIL